MSTDSDQFGRMASAEKQLCDQAGPLLAEIIRGVEDRYGVKIAEVRVTLDANDGNSWSGANCVIVREEERLSAIHGTPPHWGTKVHQALSKS